MADTGRAARPDWPTIPQSRGDTIMKHRLIAAALSAAILLGASTLAIAQTTGQDLHHPEAGASVESAPDAAAPSAAGRQGAAQAPAESSMMGGMMGPGMMGGMAAQGMPQGGMAPGMMGMGQMPIGSGMMMCPMMAGMHHGMMPMMHAMMAAGMPQMHGSAPMGGGAVGLGFGIVMPSRHLSIEDVRHHFEHRLELLGNPRLKVGDVEEADKDAIVAEIVTTEGSLVDRLSVDRHTGAIERLP
ncbi:MAG TPA: hypothetical protein VED46_02900 [Alphaproteobacteria bacterium]|nr:hypothetical protein [Alphaproteobacteria bacterium]